MANSIVSKNLYDLLGNDPELDPDREPEPPTKAIDKPVQRTGKRNSSAEGTIPSTGRPRGGRGGRDAPSGNEQAFRDRGAGSYQNRSNPPDRPRDGGERGRGRGGRGRSFSGRGGAGGGDRHSRTGIAEHPKQAEHGWGEATGEGEWKDEKAGDAIAKEEEKGGFDANPPPPVGGDGATWDAGGDDSWNAGDGAGATGKAEPAEPEDKTKSYDAYLAEQAEKKMQLGGTLQARKPNEGSGKKFPEGKPVTREEEEDFIAGTNAKKTRERERKEKQFLQLDDARVREAPREGFGGRGRGGRGRGGDREFRGDRGGRGRGRGGGDREHRGGGDREHRGGGDREHRGGDREYRGGRGGGGPRGGAGGSTPNVDDKSAFPSLGS